MDVAQAPIEITHLGSGICWYRWRITGAIFWETRPAMIIRSDCRGEPRNTSAPKRAISNLDALIDIQELQAHELFVANRKAILFAVEEVDQAIKQFRAEQQRLRELSVALEQSKHAVALATERYERGLTDFLNVLDAERQEFAIEDQNAVAQEAVVIQYIALYKALGGGWELYDELPPLKEAQPAVVASIRRITNDWH